MSKILNLHIMCKMNRYNNTTGSFYLKKEAIKCVVIALTKAHRNVCCRF